MKTYLEPKEVAKMEEAAGNLRDKLLIRVLFRLGCRVSEALSLTVEDIDFNKGAVTIVHLKRRVRLSCSNCGVGIALSHIYCPKCGVGINETT
jgi:integrase/recombinase XerD